MSHENNIHTYISVAMNPVSSERKRNNMKTQQHIETEGIRKGQENITELFV